MPETPEYPDWFSHGLINFESFVLPMAGRPGLRFLQIGAFTGDITEWLCRNVLTGEGSTLIDIDTWRGSGDEPEHQQLDWRDVRARYNERVGEFVGVENGEHLKTFTGTSDQFFATNSGSAYDFVYVDGSHLAVDVLRDAVHADLYLKVGGVLAFDDYLWHTEYPPFMIPQTAIQSFMHTRETSYEVLASNYQFWLRKVTA